MILLLDTSSPVCKLVMIDGEERFPNEWQSDRNLAKGLLGFLQTNLESRGWTWADIKAIGVFEGPGSFTGLRIGLTVANTLADSQNIPIVGGQGENWQDLVLEKLKNGKNEKIVMPFYGSEANITAPRK